MVDREDGSNSQRRYYVKASECQQRGDDSGWKTRDGKVMLFGETEGKVRILQLYGAAGHASAV